MDIFKKEYVLRRFEPQEVTQGYPCSPYSDSMVKLNVQPLSTKELMALPEGMRGAKRITAIGGDLNTVNELLGVLGDRLFYKGNWYECESAQDWDNTPAGQRVSTLVICGKSENAGILKAPDMEIVRQEAEEKEGGGGSDAK